mmetsp:Transcript_5164/g.7952  ORF Transcript_5164/g.7952 Transcript_5164/m.7952 type:complete len:93 (+) Transcript_5164:3074-3352(+)
MGPIAKLSIRKDPHYEFFVMLLMAHKANHPKRVEVHKLNHKKLFDQATLIDKKGFHEFPAWVEREVQKTIDVAKFRRHGRQEPIYFNKEAAK